MVTKNHFFVTIDTKEIRDVSIDDNQVEYEIIADEQELLEIQQIFQTMDNESKDAVEDISINPFDEAKVDSERETYDRSLISVYQRLYELGTEETKNKIKELGII
ncbi:hypothetical protein [Oceanobacillus rekensis]|uniref:hypothetical protein n=1 Tax=Oceanobacillus rekensis TaxID=937927 RepID=UPI000B44C7C1|nr:hypothetical protein [Oceanobacillus rekensis]